MTSRSVLERVARLVEQGYAPRIARKKAMAIVALVRAERRGSARGVRKWMHVNTRLDVSLSSAHDWSRAPSGKAPESKRRLARRMKGLAQ